MYCNVRKTYTATREGGYLKIKNFAPPDSQPLFAGTLRKLTKLVEPQSTTRHSYSKKSHEHSAFHE